MLHATSGQFATNKVGFHFTLSTLGTFHNEVYYVLLKINMLYKSVIIIKM